MNEMQRRRICWIVILVSVAGMIVATNLFAPPPEEDDGATLAILTLQGKLLIALNQFQPGAVADQLKPLDDFAVTPRLTRVIALLHADLGGDEGVEAGLALLDRIAVTDEDTELVRKSILEPERLTSTDRERLREELGFFGRLAAARGLDADHEDRLAVAGEVNRQLMLFAAAALSGLLALVAGCVLLLLALIRQREGRLPMRFEPQAYDSTIGLEAFAVYLAGMFFSQVVIPLIGLAVLSLPLLIGFSVLGVLWPSIRRRGGPAQMFGLNRGDGFWKEVGCGVLGYLTILPVFGFAFMVTLLLTVIVSAFSGDGDGSPQLITHPAIQWIAEGNLWVRLAVLAFASGFAPFFEEAMFRGAFWRGLRSRHGILISGTVMALVFAAIHPQGWVTIPPLAALAFGFAMLREWRDSLVASMTAHALHNGVLVTIMILSFG
jgi:membrane protease YdiL (CAAX protease family)